MSICGGQKPSVNGKITEKKKALVMDEVTRSFSSKKSKACRELRVSRGKGEHKFGRVPSESRLSRLAQRRVI